MSCYLRSNNAAIVLELKTNFPFRRLINMDSHSIESSNQEKITNRNPCSLSFASLELLSKYGNRRKLLNGKKLNKPSYSRFTESEKISTVDIVKVARARYIQEISGEVFALINPYQFGLSSEITRDVELLLLLIVSASNVFNKQFGRARRLLSACDHTAFYMGNPVQRVVHYFTESLQKRIDRETGWSLSYGEHCKSKRLRLEEGISRVQPCMFAYKQKLPFYAVTEYAGTQAILDSMVLSKRIHLVDFGIGCGSHITILIQAFAVRKEYPIEILKVTAVGMKSKSMIEDVGRRLSSFADTMSLPFSFKVVIVANTKDLNVKLFELEDGEEVAVYSSLFLRSLLPRFNQLENIFNVIRKLCPVVVVVTEIEANTCSEDFMDRFIESLTFYGANFDSFEACMDSCDPNRMTLESEYFSTEIEDVVGSEDEERRIGHMKVDGWRSFFGKLKLLELELSMSSLYQAYLVANRFACMNSCSFDMDGKCLLVGWKGTPIFSLSAWKFNYEEEKS